MNYKLDHPLLTWLFIPVKVFGHENAAPPETQRAIQPEESDTVDTLIDILKALLHSLQVCAIVGIVAGRLTVVLVPVLCSHGNREIDSGKQAQHRADDQRCGIAVVHHGFEDVI